MLEADSLHGQERFWDLFVHMLVVVRATSPRLAGFIFYWIPSVRHLPRLITALSNLYRHRYDVDVNSTETALIMWERHHAYIEEVVPKEKLLYYNVRDGWEPLCKLLDKPVPDIPFPRLNDAGDLEKAFHRLDLLTIVRAGLD